MMLKTEANEKQKIAFQKWADKETEEILYGGAKNGGKSYLGVSCIFSDALTYPETSYFIAREELNDLRKFTIPTIHEVFKNWGITPELYAKFNGQDNVYNLYNGSKVYLISCKYLPSDPMFEGFGSMQMTRGWIEEAGEVHELAYENLKLSIGRVNNDKYGLSKKLLITCNPKKNWLYRLFYLPWKQGQMPKNQCFIKALVTDNSFRQSGAVETLDQIRDKTTRMRLRYGEWEYDSDPTSLVPYDAILEIFRPIEQTDRTQYLTIDVARLGKDKAVIAHWRGLQIIKFYVYDISRIDYLQEQARNICDEHGIQRSNVIADEDGVGGGFVDNFKCKGFVANHAAVQPTAAKIDPTKRLNYASIKDQCGFMLADAINKRQLYITDVANKDQVIEEIEQLKQDDLDNDRKLKLLDKASIKDNIGRSPDFLDTLIMRMWFEAQKIAKVDTTGIKFEVYGGQKPYYTDLQ